MVAGMFNVGGTRQRGAAMAEGLTTKEPFAINVRAEILTGGLEILKNGRTLITFHNPLRNCKRTFFRVGEG